MFFSHIQVPRAEKVSELSKDDNDSLGDTYLNHTWTLEEKITLSILVQRYHSSWKDRTLIFNTYFHAAESSANQRPLLSENTLRTMWWRLKNGQNSNAAKDISWYDTVFSDTSIAWAATRASLEAIGTELGINIQKRTTTDQSLANETPRHTKVIKRKRAKTPLSDSSSEGEEDGLNPLSTTRRLYTNYQTPTRRGIVQHDTGLITPPNSSQKAKRANHSDVTRRLPRFAFRAFSRSSQGLNSPIGLRAGRFVESIAIPSPSSCQSPSYRDDARRHISSTPNGMTPFISVTRNLLRAFHHGFKTASDSSIAVVDLYKAEGLHPGETDRSFATVQSVRSLQLESPDGYSGSGEYLIWGEVAENAITSCQSIAQILSTMPINGDGCPFYMDTISSSKYSTTARNQIKKIQTPLTLSTGQAVGNLLRSLRIPLIHLDDAVHSVICDWEFNASKSGRWRKNNDFMKGVHEGFRNGIPRVESGMKHSADNVPKKNYPSNNYHKKSSDNDLIFEDTEDERGDQGLYSQEGVMGTIPGIKRADSQTWEDAVPKEYALDRASDGKQMKVELMDGMDRSTRDEDLWAQAFRDDLGKTIDAESADKTHLRRKLFSLPLDKPSELAGYLPRKATVIKRHDLD